MDRCRGPSREAGRGLQPWHRPERSSICVCQLTRNPARRDDPGARAGTWTASMALACAVLFLFCFVVVFCQDGERFCGDARLSSVHMGGKRSDAAAGVVDGKTGGELRDDLPPGEPPARTG